MAPVFIEDPVVFGRHALDPGPGAFAPESVRYKYSMFYYFRFLFEYKYLLCL
jgi:hypothetical protein